MEKHDKRVKNDNRVKNENKVLACVDRSRFADFVADYAVWAARRLDAPLEFLHVIDRQSEKSSGEDHSGAIGINAQESLLQRLSRADEAIARTGREQGRELLTRLRARALAAGAAMVDVRQRHGALVDTLADLQGGARLIVLGRRGESADTHPRDVGRQVENVVRSMQKPVWTVSEPFVEPRRVMIAFDGRIVTRRGVEMVAASPLFRGLPLHLLMSGRQSAEANRQLAWAQTTLQAAGFEVHPLSIPGDAESVIARTLIDQGIDLLVMGAYSHSRLRSLLLGSKTTGLLRSARVPTLLLR